MNIPTRTKDEASPQLRPAEEDQFELGSFTQNIASLESVVTRMETEVSSDNPNADRLNIFQTEAQSLLGELQNQQSRAIRLRGVSDENVQRLQNLISVRIGAVLRKSEEIVRQFQARLASLNAQRAALNSGPLSKDHCIFLAGTTEPELKAVRELAIQYLSTLEKVEDLQDPHNPNSAESHDRGMGLTGIAMRLDEMVNSQPNLVDGLVSPSKELLDFAMAAGININSTDGVPPRGPVDTPSKGGDDGGMEARITSLEKFAEEARKDLRSVDVRLAKIEVAVEGLTKHSATKADISQLESTLLKWFIGTALALASVAFAAAKLIS